MVRLLIVDDQKILLDALTNALSKEKEINIVGSLTVADVADVACARLRPNLVLMDICTEGKVSGIFAADRIKKKYPDIKVMLMTGFPELSFIKRAREVGVDSFIYKNSSMEEFVQCIFATMAGKGTFPEADTSHGFGDGECPLTPRELEILRLFCSNHSRKEMAEALHITTSTINYHINNMLTKTGYKNLMSLAMEATNKGYIKAGI